RKQQKKTRQKEKNDEETPPFYFCRTTITYPAVKRSRWRIFFAEEWLRNTSIISAALASTLAPSHSGPEKPRVVPAIISADHAVNRVIPTEALGAGVDGHEKGECTQMFTDKNI